MIVSVPLRIVRRPLRSGFSSLPHVPHDPFFRDATYRCRFARGVPPPSESAFSRRRGSPSPGRNAFSLNPCYFRPFFSVAFVQSIDLVERRISSRREVASTGSSSFCVISFSCLHHDAPLPYVAWSVLHLLWREDSNWDSPAIPLSP